MNRNSCILYSNVNEVYQKLIIFCSSRGFKVKEINEKFYFLRAKKNSIFFWRTVRLELEILAVEKDRVQVTAMIFKMRKRQPKLENEYIVLIENFINDGNIT